LLDVSAVTDAQPERTARWPKSFSEVGMTVLDEAVADAAWSPDGRRLAYAKRDALDRYIKIWTARVDGTDQRCLTCAPPAPARHCGGVTWHPSGQFLVFSAENEDVRSRKADMLAEPGIGLNTNLWAISLDGDRAWPLTHDVTSIENPRGAIHPQFSPDGSQIVWAGPVARNAVRKGQEWGEWALFLADFAIEDGTPVLRNIRSLQPGDQHSFYEAHDWSPDGRFVLFSGNLAPGQSVNGLDIYELDLATGVPTRLTRTDTEWDEHAHYSGDGRSVYWASAHGLSVRFRSVTGLNWMRDIKTELWVMKRDGSDKRRVTWFNEPGRRDCDWFQQNVYNTKRVFVTDSAINADTSRAAVTLAYQDHEGQVSSVLVIVEIDRRRPSWQ
jgi:Tol biopolymer transport system component